MSFWQGNWWTEQTSFRNYLKVRSDESSPQTGSEKNTFALSLSKGSSLPTQIVLR